MTKKNGNVNEYSVKIKVVGIGGGGGNALSRMRDDFTVKNIDFIAINTDAQDLDSCNANKKIYVGKNLTRGLGAGMNPEIGRQAAEENRSEIIEALKGADLVFITAGLGGGTGSGGSSVVAEIARELGSLTIGVVTKPFSFEGAQRNRIAQDALIKLKEKVDTMIVVPNDRTFSIIQKDTPIIKAFEYIDEVLRYAVQGISEMIAMPGIVNVDFADVRAVMQDAGSALVGIGRGSGQDRALTAVSQAVNSPLLEVAIDGAKGVLFTVASNRDLKMTEINDVAKTIAGVVDPNAKIIFGAYNDRNLSKGQLKVTLVATGFNGSVIKSESSQPLTSLFAPASSSAMLASATTIKEKEVDRELNEEEKPKVTKESKKNDDVWDIPTFLRKSSSFMLLRIADFAQGHKKRLL